MVAFTSSANSSEYNGKRIVEHKDSLTLPPLGPRHRAALQTLLLLSSCAASSAAFAAALAWASTAAALPAVKAARQRRPNDAEGPEGK